MNTSRQNESTHPGFWVALGATLLLAVTLSGAATSAPETGPALSGADLPSILESRPEAAGVQHDALAFFEARRMDRGDDPLTLGRIAGIRLLRFRASGSLEELRPVREVVTRLSERDPDDPAVHSLNASLALATHDFPAAVRSARASRATSDPGADDGEFRLFDALWASGEYDEAEKILNDTDDAIGSIGRLSREARLIDGRGDVEVAGERMERVVELVDAYAEPGVTRAWARVELGYFLAHSGRPGAATDRFRQALDLVPGYPSALEGLGWIAYGFDRNLPIAQTLFERAMEHGGHLDIQLVLAEVVGARGGSIRADSLRADFVRRATADTVTERMHLRPLALTLAENPATLDRALEYAERDLELRHDRMAWAVRGSILSRMGRTPEAIADMERALAWGSPEPDVLHLAGRAFMDAGYTRRGTRLLARALDGGTELGPVVVAEIEGERGMRD